MWLLSAALLSLVFFLVALATGRRAVYPILVASGMAVVGATLVAYYREKIGRASCRERV